jgi:SulP family sulfate permease
VPNPRTAKRDFVTDPHLPECPQLKVVRLDGSLFFGAVSHVAEALARLAQHRPGQRHLAISATGINFIDIAGAEFLAQEAAQRRASGGGLYLIRPKPEVLHTLERGGYLDSIGRERIFPGKTTALTSIVERLDPEGCRLCTQRIFRECVGRPGATLNPTGINAA